MEDLKVAVFTVLNQVFMTFLTNMLPNARAGVSHFSFPIVSIAYCAAQESSIFFLSAT